MSKAIFKEAAAPATPPSGYAVLYFKTDSKPYMKNDAGAESPVLIDASAFATSTQGTAADDALPKAGGEMSGDITMAGTEKVDGRDLSVDGTKLDAVEAAADKTDATNVGAAGAVMDSDISEGEGFLRKTGSGAYEGIKTNLGATTAPTANEDSGDGYAIGSLWLDTTADKAYICLDATVASAVWKLIT